MLSAGNGSGQKGAAAGKVVLELDLLGPRAPSVGGSFRGSRTIVYVQCVQVDPFRFRGQK